MTFVFYAELFIRKLSAKSINIQFPCLVWSRTLPYHTYTPERGVKEEANDMVCCFLFMKTWFPSCLHWVGMQ